MLPNKIMNMYCSLFVSFIIAQVSEWLTPVENQFKELLPLTTNDTITNFEDDEKFKGTPNTYLSNVANLKTNIQPFDDLSPTYFKNKLEETLNTAKRLAEVLKKQIMLVENRELLLKQAITDGRSGVTTLTVSTLGLLSRSYIIRDGFWTLCNGMIQHPTNSQTHNLYTDLFSAPRCIGQEITSRRDPCVFNSIIQYDTIPTTRRSSYSEESYLCLKTSFNNTLEQYLSVPKRVVDETCNGIIKRLSDNVSDCGLRILSEYTYYPQNRQSSSLSMEYCSDKDGSCKLMVGWHLSNNTIENFEFLKHDANFKKFFLQTEAYMEPFI